MRRVTHKHMQSSYNGDEYENHVRHVAPRRTGMRAVKASTDYATDQKRKMQIQKLVENALSAIQSVTAQSPVVSCDTSAKSQVQEEELTQASGGSLWGNLSMSISYYSSSLAAKSRNLLAGSSSIKSLLEVNDYNIKLYGSERAVLAENERILQHIASGNIIIHPASTTRLLIDLTTMVMLVASIVIIPFQLAFYGQTNGKEISQEEELSVHFLIFKWVTDIWFMIDIVANFYTGLIESTMKSYRVIFDKKIIAKAYIRGFFFVDLISTCPFDVIATLVGYYVPGIALQGNKTQFKLFRTLKFTRLLSLFKLLRLGRLMRYLDQAKDTFKYQYESMLGLLRWLLCFFIIFLLCHYCACLQYAIPYMVYGVETNMPNDVWIVRDGYRVGAKKPIWHRYSMALVRATSQLLCIGYGIDPPTNAYDIMVCVFSVLLGALTFAIFIGYVTSNLQQSDASKRSYKEKIMQVKDYMHFRKFPVKLRRRISNYYENRYHGRAFNEDDIVDSLNPRLRAEINNFNCYGLVKGVPLFKFCDDHVISEIITCLQYESYLTGDEIVSQGSTPRALFLISQGSVRVSAVQYPTLDQTINDGGYFGEFAFLVPGTRRQANVVAASQCYVYALPLEAIDTLESRLPQFKLQYNKGCKWHTDNACDLLDVMPRKLRAMIADLHNVKSVDSRLSHTTF